jgi:ABC-2 type transport system permease protein
MSIISLIIKKEFVAKVRNKSFIVMTFLSPLLFVGIALFVGYLSSMKADTKQIAIHDESGRFVGEFLAKNKTSEEYNYLDLSLVDLPKLKKNIVDETYEGILFIPKAKDNTTLENQIQFISNESPSISFIEKTQRIIAKKRKAQEVVTLNNDDGTTNRPGRFNYNESGAQFVKMNDILFSDGKAMTPYVKLERDCNGKMIQDSQLFFKTKENKMEPMSAETIEFLLPKDNQTDEEYKEKVSEIFERACKIIGKNTKLILHSDNSGEENGEKNMKSLFQINSLV